MDRLKLRGRIIERFGTLGRFSEAAGVSRVTISSVLGGKSIPRLNTMKKWCELLGIERDEIGPFFYPETLEN